MYYGGNGEYIPVNEGEAINMGLTAAMDYLNKYPDDFIRYTTTIPLRQKAFDIIAYTFNEYIKFKPYKPGEVVAVEDEICEEIKIEWKGKSLRLPVPLKGFLDKVCREDGKIKIYDYKVCSSFSDPEKIDGAKMLQAVTYFLLVYSKYGEMPYSLTYEEIKMSQNRDGSPQVRQYEIVFAENQLYFEFFFRFYQDMVRAVNGEQVFVPNVYAMFDNDVAIIAYIHRLDIEEERAKMLQKHNVENITDALKNEIVSAGNMRKFLKTVEKEFVSAKSLNYEAMEDHEKIVKKLMEHGMAVQFESIVNGATVDLYQYVPSMGLKMSRLRSYVEDIEQVLGVSGVRVLAPIPNSTLIGFEVPKTERVFPSIPAGSGFDVAIGQDIMGMARRFDIRTAPHILVAGSSGSGKSVFLSGLIEQLSRIQGAEIHLFDPKRVELMHYKSKAVEYENDIEKIHNSLHALEAIMHERYKAMEKAGVRSIDGMSGMPYKFVIIDEFGELIAAKHIKKIEEVVGVYERGERVGQQKVKCKEINISAEIENSILRLAQLARAAGIHLVIATQRPSTDVIKGTIKANFPTKVVFKTAKSIDSLVVMDEAGAEKLAGKGDMLFVSDSGVERLQGYNI